jgi:hypothetical protein
MTTRTSQTDDLEIGESTALLGSSPRNETFEQWKVKHLLHNGAIIPSSDYLEWLNVYFWIQIQSWCLLAAVFVIIFTAHMVPLLVTHHEWHSCDLADGTFMPWCAVLFHVVEVPVAILFTYVSYLGFFRTTYANRTTFNTLANANIAFMLVFLAFEFLVVWQSYLSAGSAVETFVLSLFPPFFLVLLCIVSFVTFGKIRPFLDRRSLGGLEQHSDGYYHPTSLQEVMNLVHAVEENASNGRSPCLVRIRGALHSFPHEITGISVDPAFGTVDQTNACVQMCTCAYLCCGSGASCLNFFTGPMWKCILRIFGCCKVGRRTYGQSPLDHSVAAVVLDFLEFDDKETVHFYENDGTMYAKACSGINLGNDPNYYKSMHEKGFNVQIDEKGYAIADLGGITHQTIGGFLSTGSSGGTVKYTLEDNLLAFTIIDGNGIVQYIEKGDMNVAVLDHEGKIYLARKNIDNKLYNAVGVSLGLLGIITHVTFKLENKFYLEGYSITQKVKNIDFMTNKWAGYEGTNETSVADYFDGLMPNGARTVPSPVLSKDLFTPEYSRILWLPQPGVESMMLWNCQRTQVKPTEIVEYQQVQGPIQASAEGLIFTIGTDQLEKEVRDYVKVNGVITAVLFADDADTAKPFYDTWFHGLPMDNQMPDDATPIVFTEMWLPLEDADKVMQIFHNYFHEDGRTDTQQERTGFAMYEIYACGESPFWLSPAYKRKVFRMDVFWWARSNGTFVTQPQQFYSDFWKLLDDHNIDFRCHWGKYQDQRSQAVINRRLDSYDKMDDFLKLRKEMDPRNMFLTSYWIKTLNIKT